MNFRNSIAKQDVFDFKENFCDENEIITRIFKNDLQQYFVEPILDVGAGIGDIAYKSLANKRVVMIDVNDFSFHDYPCSPEHKRKMCNLFDFESDEQVNTILISHTLQFIDDDITKLNNKLKELSPLNVVLVLNTNRDFMGDLIEWSNEYFEKPNPEVNIPAFPKGYALIKNVPFTATLKCPDFKTLAKQVSYLMLIDLEEGKEELLLTFLKDRLLKPEFKINQSIDVYQRYEDR